jgi:hypothetical protein
MIVHEGVAVPVTDTAKTVQDQILGALTSIEGAVVDAVRAAAERAEPVVPDVPSTVATQASDIADNAFSFAEQLLKNQREFVGKLLDATGPLYGSKPKSAPASKRSATAA